MKYSQKADRVRKIIRNLKKTRPRLSVFRSNKYIFAQIINDQKGITLVSASQKEIEKKTGNLVIAQEVGKLLAKRALDKKISEVVFDRGRYKYHGLVKALAEGARKGGLKF